MYSSAVILDTLLAFKRKYGWMPERHSIDEVDRFNTHLNAIVEIDRNNRSTTITPKRDLTAKEIRWIENERAMSWADASYFKTRYCYIVDSANNARRYTPRKAQQVFAAILAEFDELQVAIELLVLKARQLGVSTEVGLDFIHRLVFVPRTQAIMASVNDETSGLLQRMASNCLDMQPWWLVPGRKRDRTGKLLEYNTGSVLSIQSGAQKMGIGQGWTPTLVHISECGDYPNPKKTLEEGLMRATHPSSSLFAVYEGTGNGNTGWWADSWRTAKELYPKGQSRLCPLFLPWVTAPDLYPLPDWVKKFGSGMTNWKPMKETEKHALKCEAYIRSTPILAKIFGSRWDMPREQMFFWEFNYREALHKHTAKVWLQQMPADDREALQGKNDSVFGLETIEVVTKNQLAYRAYGITGAGIDDEFEPNDHEIDWDQPRIRITWMSPLDASYTWELIPLQPFDESEEANSMGKLLVWEEPNEIDGIYVGPKDYSIGVDCSDGLGQDRSVACVTRNSKDGGFDRQVAEFAHDRVNAPQMVGFVACLAAWYGNETIDQRGAKICIEQRRKPGDDCQLQLKRMGFNYHHRMIQYDGRKIDENNANREGWFTNAWSRPMLLGRWIDAVENGWLQMNSPFLIAEGASFERTAANGKLAHQQGKHDDRIFAQAMAYFTYHALDSMIARAKKRYNLPTEALPELEYEWADGTTYEIEAL